ncbi:prolow-density lipoprotein receptor-related protein 1-like isoform X3 [Dreissena polymorpha]|uniref:prolow-density lipoprotein receptor-related protein 1-like isoform X3 n=1 Tax=Dreissena polymorpha TaxID=45954 RepID=UPI002263E1DF|nr:prolow-density lipoprotein receptor-related protein 1-like isoform X3 [Dreissena polymorpha]
MYSNEWFCDHEPDCRDKSDEDSTKCPTHTCHHWNFKCKKNNGSVVCLPAEQVCDNTTECDDPKDTDEGGLCNATMCQSKPCGNDQDCYNTPYGYTCKCPPGQKFNGSSCIVTNPCLQWGTCSQACTLDDSVTKGYQCSCHAGYFLKSDDFTCKPLESDPVYVIFSNRHELRRVDTATSSAVSLISGLRNTIALDFYYNRDGYAVLFWTDVMEDKIYRGTMMGNALSDVRPIVSSGLATTEGVAVDWIGENIYWVESSLDQIEVAKLDGTNRTTLIAGNMSSPRAIAVDPTKGRLFWTDWEGSNPRIETCSMDGDPSTREVLYRIIPTSGGGWPNGITLDYENERIYWIDARSESIHTLTYSGRDYRLVLKNSTDMRHPFALALFGTEVYWTDWSTNSVVMANKYFGTNVTVVQKTITQPFDLQVVHPKRQPRAPNPCSIENGNGGCSDLCLIGLNGTVGCRCPHRKKLGANNKTCEEDKKFLLFVKNQEIRGVDLQKGHFNVLPVITIPHVDMPTAIDYDVELDYFYWADKGLNVINRANFSASVETLIDKGLKNTEGFAIDWLSGNMYFSSYDTAAKTASISVATLTGSFRTEVIKNDIVTKPHSIALHPLQGVMYFTDVHGDPGQHQLFRTGMDGSEKAVLFSNLHNPSSLCVDTTSSPEKLYFINDSQILWFNINDSGSNPAVNLVKVQTSLSSDRPEALTVDSEHIYVSIGGRIISINKSGSNEILETLRDSTPNVNALILYDTQTRKKDSQNVCHRKNHGCSQLCLPKNLKLSSCVCTAGFSLGKDNSNCEGITSFLLYAKETEIRGQTFLDTNQDEALPPISQIQALSAIDFHAADDMIYWVDTTTNSISRIKRDLTNKTVVVKKGILSVEGLAVEWVSGLLYWTDAGHSTVEVSTFDGSNRHVIASGDMEKPKSIVVDPVDGYVYWSDWGTVSRIERANLDGSNRVQYIYTDIGKPWGLTIDYDTHFLYWCDTALKTIEYQDLRTGTRSKLLSNIDPISVTIFKDYIYWIDGGCDRNTTCIMWANKTDGSDPKVMRANLGTGLKDIKAFDKSRQQGANLCKINNGGCEQLCFYTSRKNVTCACSYGKLAENGKNCTEYQEFIMFSKVTGIESVHLTDADNKNQPRLPIFDDTQLRNVIGLTFDYEDKRIFFSDIQRGDLQTAFFDGSGKRTIVEGVGSVEGIAFVKMDGKKELYWTSYTNSCISRIDVNASLGNVSQKPEVVIQMTKLDHPRAIAVDSCWQLIYWTNWNNEKPRIQRSNLQGHNMEDVIVEDILTPNGLTIDHLAKKLYWSDARLDKIERCNMDGTNREVIITAIPQHSFGLVVYSDYLFWTDWMLRAVIRANKYDGSGIVWLRKNLERQPMGIIAVAADSNNCMLHKCYADNFGCEDLCQTDLYGNPFCQCRFGRLKSDGKHCVANQSCSNEGFEAFPCLNGGCIRFEKSCNGIKDCLDASDESPFTCANRSCPSSMFACANRAQGQCIALTKRCDSVVDCHDGSDELTATCGCPPLHFQCKNNANCIRKELKCNGVGDCPDSSDEVDCGSKNCTNGYFQCHLTDICIPGHWQCNGINDCKDGSDENATLCASHKPELCPEAMFRCNDGLCINKQWHCDGDQDCTDDSDETGCQYMCPSGQYKCPGHDPICIQIAWICDGSKDCPGGEDENSTLHSCNARTCGPGQFACNNGLCIDEQWVCDFESDCTDGSDESPSAGCEPNQCDEHEFQCSNYHCIEKEFYCDHDDDCGDHSDEPAGCVPVHVHCGHDLIQCANGSCLSLSDICERGMKCDKYVTDTSSLRCADFTCPLGMFSCANGVCINETLTCDGNYDCPDESDEPASCYIDECNLYQPCTQLCADAKIGYLCSCHPGFKLATDNKTCEDVNECDTEFPCSQFCNNTPGSYYCTCEKGFDLSANKRDCAFSDQGNPPFLLVSNRYFINRVDLTPDNTTGMYATSVVQANLSHSVAVDFDYKENMIYWTDIRSQSSTINRRRLDRNDTEVLHSSTVLNPDGIAVDWVGRNLYWCDRNTDTIEVSTLNGKYRKVLVKDKSFLREPRALELFPKYGYLFISDWGDQPHISRLSMDGVQRKHIITEDLAWPNGLTIDYVTEKLFWADANYDYIGIADLDGQNRHRILEDNVPHPFAITAFVDKIYWTDWESNGVHSARKFSGDKHVQIAHMSHRPMALVVFHKLRQPEMDPNPCVARNCSYLCLLTVSDRPGGLAQATCQCPENHVPVGKNSCKPNCDESQFLCKQSSKCIPHWWQCDKNQDCEDGSDENMENGSECASYPCSQPGLFKCSSAKNASGCVPPSFICDGNRDCDDGSDETKYNCTTFPCMTGQYKCTADNMCISSFKVCDGKHDCTDGADELNCTKEDCLSTQFRCNSTGNCIPYLWQCDGDYDCAALEDEKDCDKRACKESYKKCNKTNKCIPEAWFCDGENDCGEGDTSDEGELCHEKTCGTDYLRCNNGHCIPRRWQCDGDQDCSDGSDENNCPVKNCTEGEFSCKDRNRCIPIFAVCDGKSDCADYSDEKDCPNKANCSQDQFLCKNTGMCIPHSWQCDGEKDCADGDDEKSCEKQGICRAWEHHCDNMCISALWVCDGEKDCSEGEDETHCDAYTCPPDWFKCSDGVCIPRYKVCDGTRDCKAPTGLSNKNMTKWNDEADHLCKATCAIHEVKCKNREKCIDISQLCDQVNDCSGSLDSSDEINCLPWNVTKCPSNHTCQHSCSMNTTLGRMYCTCKPGFELGADGKSCKVMNPCNKFGACDQLCIPEKEKPFCICATNYKEETLVYNDTLRYRFCSAIGNDPKLLIPDENNLYIQSHNLTQSRYILNGASDKDSTLGKVISLDVDTTSAEEVSVFILHRVNERNMIVKAVHKQNTKGNSNSPNKREADPGMKLTPLANDLTDPRSIAVDWIGNNLYWTDIQATKIHMLHYKDVNVAARKVTVINEGLLRPFAIAVDPIVGKIFYTDYGNPPKVGSANLDGSSVTAILHDQLIYPTGIAADYVNQRVYFADAKKHTIEAVKYDGTDRNVVQKLSADDVPYQLDIFEDFVYVMMFNSSRPIIKFSKFATRFPGKQNIVEVTQGLQHVGDIVILQENKQIIPDDASLKILLKTNAKVELNACQSSPCGNRSLCVNAPSMKPYYACLCGDGATYNNQSKTCDYMKCPENYCGRHGNCSVSDNNEYKCSCELGFEGRRCELDLCYKYCAANGSCSFMKAKTGLITRFCDCPPMFYGDRCQFSNCTLCKNGGHCSLDANNKTVCVCPEGFKGLDCSQMVKSWCDGYCENGGTCSVNPSRRRVCACSPDYRGERCEQCSSQVSFNVCLNNGTCHMNGERQASCTCQPGYDNRTYCEKKTCVGYCKFDSECSLVNNQLRCRCRDGFTGERCDQIVDCNLGPCKNRGTCHPSNNVDGPPKCECPPGFRGQLCEIATCQLKCLNGGTCTFGENSKPYCTCSKEFIGATCELCANPLLEEPRCNQSRCHDYCFQGGQCIGCQLVPGLDGVAQCRKCECPKPFCGPRCQTRHCESENSTVSQAKLSIATIMVPVLSGLVVVVAIVLFVLIRSRRSQFRHRLLKDKVQVSNPIYMPQTTEDDGMEDDAHQPLDQPFDFDPEKGTYI